MNCKMPKPGHTDAIIRLFCSLFFPSTQPRTGSKGVKHCVTVVSTFTTIPNWNCVHFYVKPSFVVLQKTRSTDTTSQ